VLALGAGATIMVPIFEPIHADGEHRPMWAILESGHQPDHHQHRHSPAPVRSLTLYVASASASDTIMIQRPARDDRT